MLRKFLSTLVFFVSISVHGFEVQGYNVSKSWENAIVYVPSNFLNKTVDTVKVDKPMPVVILMHGCSGINDHERTWANYLKSNGFIVVLPDSFAIPNRVVNCASSAHITNLGKVPVNELRPAEAEYAMLKVKEQSWADKNNIFLMGHSEGGMAAYLTKELGFNGVIISGFPCTVRGGFRSDSTTPVLVIAWETDPFFIKSDRLYTQCSDRPFWKNRQNAFEIILPGKGHATAFESSAKHAVDKFLKDFIK